MISEAKLAACRRNGAKGGVKTREGKLKSRRNALKHGHRAEVVVPEDFQAEADEKFRQLVDEIRPEGTIETGMARRMAFELTKLERLERQEHAALAERVRTAGEAFEEAQRRRVEACMQLLPQQPARAVRGLLGFTAGCNWLLGEWGVLRERLDSGTWGDEEARRAWVLLGGRDAGPDGAAVAATIAEELGALESERDAVWEELDGPLRQEAEDRALLDTSPDGQMRHRYEGQAVRHLHKVIDQYCKGRQGWFEPKATRRGRPAPNEPTAEVLESLAVRSSASARRAAAMPVAADPHPGPLPGGEGVRSGPAAPNEPTAEILVLSQVTPTQPLHSSSPRGEGRGEGREAAAARLGATGSASNPCSESVAAVHGFEAEPVAPGAALSPEECGGEGAGAPNEPNAEPKVPQDVATQPRLDGGTIRREIFTAPTAPSRPLFIDGIRVR